MDCLKCGAEFMTRVIDTRDKHGRGVLRKRECTVCGYRFSTIEIPVETAPGKVTLPPVTKKMLAKMERESLIKAGEKAMISRRESADNALEGRRRRSEKVGEEL